ncbi:hypothetical protein [Aquibacillus saliphilus]|uniref:hypothetical protein n=1 Tax=Aquibacillus saliphilus TaxID=1909422 RepID=UPI001CEFD778|nr:hypothetical protein [Aquibacillus saliphilus]
MPTQEKYVLQRVKIYCDWNKKKDNKINPEVLIDLIDQWEFDYQMDKTYRPEVLEFETVFESRWIGKSE